ncbi:hypothetical protein F4801DRAFT_541567 [Xylaria longipes]|nr:hypothetical protein F4801DRAFT_541567 [Xylaria longipes]
MLRNSTWDAVSLGWCCLCMSQRRTICIRVETARKVSASSTTDSHGLGHFKIKCQQFPF